MKLQNSSLVNEVLLASVTLIVIELVCFLPIMHKVGFYLDDWATLAYMHFGPKEHGVIGLMKYYGLTDTLVVIRPIEAVHFGLAYWNFGLKPFPWHLVNMVLEIVVALLTFTIMRKLVGSAAVALFAAIFILLCPSHDSSHYWVVCSSVTLSFALYLGSVLATVEALIAARWSQRLAYYGLSTLLFLLSLFNYEMFLPLALVNVLVTIIFNFRVAMAQPIVPSRFAATLCALRASFPVVLAMVLPVASLLLYLKVIVPRISAASMRVIHFDPQVFLTTIFKGVELNTPISFLSFLVARTHEGLDCIARGEVVRVLAIVVVAVVAVAWMSRGYGRPPIAVEGQVDLAMPGMPLMVIGLLTIVASYTIFGLCPDYPPTFMTLFNRINTGASFGLVLFFAGLFSIGLKIDGPPLVKSSKSILLLVFSASMACTFTLANFGLSKPWIASWSTQKHIQGKLLSVVKALPRQSSILLMNCPRYVMWAPVYDGVWDFQNTARILLNQENFNANVVSERLSLDRYGVKDVSHGTECGAYPFASLYLLAAPTCSPLRTENPKQFVDLVEEHGMGFGLQKDALEKWKEEALKLEN